MWVSSTAHQLVPALCHPLVSFQCPSKLLPVLTASKGEADAWKDLTLRKRKLAGWLVQVCGTNQARRENPLGVTGEGAVPSESPAVPAIFHTIDFFACGNASPKPVYSDDVNCCD